MFDGGRKMFEKGKAIREAQKARLVKKALEKEQERIQNVLRKHGVNIPPEAAEVVLRKRSEDDSQPLP